MRNILYVIGSLLVIAALHFSGILNDYNLTHPVWRENATRFGSLIGIGIAFLLFWLTAKKPALAKNLVRFTIFMFVVSLAATLYFSYTFINATEFNPMAAQIWHKGSYAVFATFAPSFAFLLRKLFG